MMKAKHLLSGMAAALMAAGVYAADPSYDAQSESQVETGSQLEGAAGEGAVTPSTTEYGSDTSAATVNETEGAMSYENNGVERKRDMGEHPAGSTGSSLGGIAGDGEVTTTPELESGYQGFPDEGSITQ